ncbi:unnamed protein product [Lactuca saligna]|uniref:Uncharacterized protein n=1 Tax=Lactuca saligna TaxID=75948 RepID=A0AA35ZIP7_LACSI|nr:unnamed protein product [Lactuca saligna]
MPKVRRDNSVSTDKSRHSPYKCNTNTGHSKRLEKDQNLKEWEEARCPLRDEKCCACAASRSSKRFGEVFFRKTNSTLCSSHDNNCRPYMCDTSLRHSNCFNQFRKSFETPATTGEPPSIATVQESKVVCPLCRGQVKGWVVVEAAREFMNTKSRSCTSETCQFSGVYSELRRHARVVHPLVRPSEVDLRQRQEWRWLEGESDLLDFLRTLESTLRAYVVNMSRPGNGSRRSRARARDAVVGES